MSLEEILGAAAGAGRVVKAVTVLEKGSSFPDSYLSRHTSGFILLTSAAIARTSAGRG